MRLRRADKLCHIEFVEASRELDFCSVDFKYESLKEHKRLNQFVSWYSSFFDRFLISYSRIIFNSDSSIHF